MFRHWLKQLRSRRVGSIKTGRRDASLELEVLEDRSLMTAAGLNPTTGLLKVLGTEAAETITVRHVNNRILVAGIAGSFPASQVKEVAVNARGGDDRVNLNVAGQAVRCPARIIDNDNGTIQGANDGIITLSWANFCANFDRLDRANYVRRLYT